MKKRRLFLAMLSAGISAGLVAWLLGSMDPEQARLLVRNADWRWLILAGALSLCLPFCNTLRWRGVLRAATGKQQPELSFFQSLRAVLLALVLNSFLPSKSGDLAKAFYLKRHGGLAFGIGTVILERLVDLSVLGILGIGGYLLSDALWGLFAGTLLLGGVASGFSLILLAPLSVLPEKIQPKAKNFRSIFRSWKSNPQAIAQTLVGSLATWLLAGGVVCALLRALGQNLEASYTFSVYPLAVLAGLVPTTISGIGTRDAAFAELLQGGGLGREAATLVALGYTVFVYWLLSLVGLPAVALELRRYFSANRKTK